MDLILKPKRGVSRATYGDLHHILVVLMRNYHCCTITSNFERWYSVARVAARSSYWSRARSNNETDERQRWMWKSNRTMDISGRGSSKHRTAGSDS